MAWYTTSFAGIRAETKKRDVKFQSKIIFEPTRIHVWLDLKLVHSDPLAKFGLLGAMEQPRDEQGSGFNRDAVMSSAAQPSLTSVLPRGMQRLARAHVHPIPCFLSAAPGLAARRRAIANARWTCSGRRRRKNVGVPKGIESGARPPALLAEESPWEDYLIPQLEGNSVPREPARFARDAVFTVLGVESSCDDTAAAVVRSDGVVLGEARVSQDELTEVWGGVVPHVARDAHADAIARVIENALANAEMRAEELDAISVTMGPGLEICLRVGYRAARALAVEHDKEFVAINHLEAHILVARCAAATVATDTAENGAEDGIEQEVQFPFLTLLVSGGHCQLLLAHDVAKYEVIGGTLDDALGEAYDKTARLLGLRVGGGGGPALEKLALSGNPRAIPFPVPMQKRSDCNFSFAGLKTSVRVAIDKLGGDDAVQNDPKVMADVAASFQDTAVRHLEQRTRRALQLCDDHNTGAKTLVVSGGVAANAVVRSRLMAICHAQGWRCAIPAVRLCTDNGVMVAWAATERLRRGIADNHKHLDVRARWPLAGLGSLTQPLPPEA